MSKQEIILYQDTNTQELNKNIKDMQERVIDLTEQKLEIENKIYNFNNQYNETVGPFLLKYLKQREENISIAIEDIQDEEKKEKLQDELKNTKDDIHKFQTNQNKQQSPISILTDEQKLELKNLYKKACRLCHPDIVDEKFKEEALLLFHRLNEANQKQNIEKVREILEYLQNHKPLSSSEISDIEILKKQHSILKSDILKLELEIRELKQNETYKKISQISNWDRYFKIVSKQIEKEIHKQ